MTPPFCIISFRWHGFCTPRGQLWAETLEFLDVHEVFEKTQKVMFDVLRSILKNYEATSTAKLTAIHVLVTTGLVSSEYQAQSSQVGRDLEIRHLGHVAKHLEFGNGVEGGLPAVTGLSFCPFHLI